MEENLKLTLTEAFNQKTTENGDVSFSKASTDNLVNLLFMSEYYQNNTESAVIGCTDRDRLFAMFMRDPRYGLGRRDLGRYLMGKSRCSINDVVTAGRVDDLFEMPACNDDISLEDVLDWCRAEIEKGNELVKKWMPRYSSKDMLFARHVAKYYGMNKQQYGKFIKCETTESRLSRKDTDSIEFEHVPSKAMLKYAKRFATGSDTAERYAKYLDDVRSGRKKMNVSTTTVYDIYRNMGKIDADLFFDKIEKISGSWIPMVDTSASMCNGNDSIGKALSIGHYLAKCSTYAPNKVLTFSSMPHLIELGQESCVTDKYSYDRRTVLEFLNPCESGRYADEIRSMVTGDCSNTNFAAAMSKLEEIGELPEYIVVLSDMEFDRGSNMRKTSVENYWKSKGYATKIIWWNLNSAKATSPECDERGNIFMSGYSPELLKFLEAGFDARMFLDNLLEEYSKRITSK